MIPDHVLTALSMMAKSFGKHFTALKTSIDDLPEKLGISKAIDGQTRILARYADKLDATAQSLKSAKLDVTVDTSVLERQLTGIATDVRAFDKPDLSNIEASLKALYTLLDKQSGTHTKALADGFAKLSEAIKASKPMHTGVMKLDEMQLRSLRSSGGGGGSAALQGRRPTLTNTTIANASTQYTYTFPANTTAWTLKLRDQDKLAYYSWTTGTLPTSGDGSNYMTIPQNFLRSIANVDYSGRTIYFGAEGATVAEIEIFQS